MRDPFILLYFFLFIFFAIAAWLKFVNNKFGHARVNPKFSQVAPTDRAPHRTFKRIPVPVSRIFFWYAEGFRLFRKDWAVWLGIILLCVALLISLLVLFISIEFLIKITGFEAIGLLKIVLIVFGFILPYLLLGGLFIGCDDLARGKGLRVGHVVAVLRQQKYELLKLGFWVQFVYGLGLFIASGFIVIGLSSLGSVFHSRFVESFFSLAALLINLVSIHAFIMALCLAVALVVFENKAASDALKSGFSTLFANILAFSLYGLISILAILTVFKVIDFGLIPLHEFNPSNIRLWYWIDGLFVFLALGPILIPSAYVAYRELYEDTKIEPTSYAQD